MTVTLCYDSFVPGEEIGTDDLVFGDEWVQSWSRIFTGSGRDPAQVPLGVVSVVAMRAYMAIVTPRPPGNIHAGQQLRIVRAPSLGEHLHTRMACTAKRLSGERRIVTFGTRCTGRGSGGTVFEGAMTIFWAC